MSNIDAFKDVESWMEVLPGMRYWIIFAAAILLLVLIITPSARSLWTAQKATWTLSSPSSRTSAGPGAGSASRGLSGNNPDRTSARPA